MVMIKINRSKIISAKSGVAVAAASISISALLCMFEPVCAGPQSLLDPYSSIQPAATQTQPLGDRTSAQKTGNKGKLKSAKAPKQSTAGQLSSTNHNATGSPGFISGIKEIQHGSVTSFKAAGHGIINGSKSAGAKIAAGGGKIKDGFSAAGHKIIPGPKTLTAKAADPKAKRKNQTRVAASNSNAFSGPSSALDSNAPALPGKPLGPVADTLPNKMPRKVKTPAAGQKNIVARTFDKLNIFAKHKPKNPNIAANDQKTGG